MIEQSATYGSLMAVAARHVAWASLSLTTEPIGDRASARSAYDARRDLLVAAGRHLLFLVGGPNRLSGRAAGLTPEPADRAALALSRALIALEPQRRGEDPPVRGVPASSWHAAVRAMGAARDLVSTHRDPLGADRSPDSDVLEDAGERAAAYVTVADLVAVVSSADRDLALRAAQAGMTWKAAERALPDVSAVDDAVRALRHEASLRSTATASPRLQRLTLARPAVTATSPAGVLMQRVGRLRQGAWTLARHERRSSAADLIEYAAAAVILHTHLAAHGNRLGDPKTARAWADARAGWAEQHRHLVRFTTGTPATAGLRAEVAALPPAAALALPVTRDATGVRAYGAASLSPSDMRRLAGACSELAALNAATLHALVERGALYIDARHLPGDRITDDVALVEAKMHGRYVPSCPSDAIDALAAYARLAAVQPRHPERAEPERSAPARTAERHLLRA